MQKELEKANALLGVSDVQGEGIILTLTDTENSKISAKDLITLLNDIKVIYKVNWKETKRQVNEYKG